MRLLWRSWPAVFLYLSANFQPRLTNASDPVAVEHRALLRFMMLYSALFSAFGLASPFLPAFLAGRGLGPEEIGLVLGAATALRLVCGVCPGRFHHLAVEVELPLARAMLAVDARCTTARSSTARSTARPRLTRPRSCTRRGSSFTRCPCYRTSGTDQRPSWKFQILVSEFLNPIRMRGAKKYLG